MAVLGNIFYACQIFTKSIDALFVVTSLPWILGSLGMLVFDFIVSRQIQKNNANVIIAHFVIRVDSLCEYLCSRKGSFI